MPRYRFAEFVLSPRTRTLTRAGEPVPLIPRYLDLLLFLIERRADAVHRRDIFDGVWTDVIVSDSALSQAIRTLRRTLDDDPREPRFIRTVSRHGYQFVCADLIEDEDSPAPVGESTLAPPERSPFVAPATRAGDEGAVAPHAAAVPTVDETTDVPAADALSPTGQRPAPGEAAASTRDDVDALLAVLASRARTTVAREEHRDIAERLHAAGTAAVLARLVDHPRAAYVRALLRDTRHLVPGAGAVPLFGADAGTGATLLLLAMRVQRAARLVAGRWLGGTLGGGLAGALAGLLGGLLLSSVPTSTTPLSAAPVLAAIGGACGLVGGFGVAAGVCFAEALALSMRRLLLVPAAACGGLVVGGATQLLARWTLHALFGRTLPIGGALEGLVIGAGVGLGYALATRQVVSGLAAPRGAARITLVLLTGAGGAVAALLLASAGLPLVGGTVHLLAQASTGAQVALTPLARLVGEPEFGPLTRAILSFGEGGSFGVGFAIGLARRP